MYHFTGFFARLALVCPARLPTGAVWREVTAPFAGVGVRHPNLTHDEPGSGEAARLLAEVGLDGETDWLFINYVTWAGRIEDVYGVGSRGGRAFGPIRASDDHEAGDAYLELMGAFGVPAADALQFLPFERGYWGE